MPFLVVVLLVAAALTLVVFGPIWTIWALNILFGLAIPVTFKTWLSVVWLSMLVGGSASGLTQKKD